MGLIQAIRNLFGIANDRLLRKKTKLEVEKLEHEKRQEQSLIHIATLEDISRYDKRVKAIIAKAVAEEHFEKYEKDIHREPLLGNQPSQAEVREILLTKLYEIQTLNQQSVYERVLGLISYPRFDKAIDEAIKKMVNDMTSGATFQLLGEIFSGWGPRMQFLIEYAGLS